MPICVGMGVMASDIGFSSILLLLLLRTKSAVGSTGRLNSQSRFSPRFVTGELGHGDKAQRMHHSLPLYSRKRGDAALLLSLADGSIARIAGQT